MATQDNTRSEEEEFAAAFNEDQGAASTEDDESTVGVQSEDGPSASDGATEGEPAAVALVVADEDALRESAEQATADATAGPASAQPGQEDEGPLDPKEEQRRKSWEGRLRAREEELARREAALNASKPEAQAIEKAAETLEAKGDEAGAESVENIAEQVESGELSAEQAMRTLSEDFGPDFVKMIEAIATSKAREAGKQAADQAAGELRGSVQEIIDDIVDSRAKAHFETIAEAHPDFNDIAQTPEFMEFAKSYPNGDAIVENGSARDIVKMLTSFKDSIKEEPAAETATQTDPALDAAEGVRSGGMRLPEQPTRAAGYEDAWDQF